MVYSFCEDAKAQGIDLDVAIKEASLYIAAQKATAELIKFDNLID